MRPGAYKKLRLGLRVLFFAALGVPVAQAQQNPDALVQRYDEIVRKATQDNEVSEAIVALDATIAEYRSLNPENPQLSSLYMLRGVLLFAVDGESARQDILSSFREALKVHPWAQFQDSMRSEPLDLLLEEARQRLPEQNSEQKAVGRRGAVYCQESIAIYAAYAAELGVESATLYWRNEGASDFQSSTMRNFEQVAYTQLSAVQHGDRSLEYYISLEDSAGTELALVGSASTPQRVQMNCGDTQSGLDGSDAGREGEERFGNRGARKRGGGRRPWGVRLSAGTGWGWSYGDSERVYDVANPQEKTHYSALAAACAIARRASPRGGPLPSADALHGGNPAAPTADSIFGRVATSTGQASQLALLYDDKRCGQMHTIHAGFASSHFHLEPELNFRFNEHWELALFARLQIIHGLDILAPVEGSPINAINPPFESLRIPMPWTVGLAGRYRVSPKGQSSFSWFVGAFAGHGSAALAVPMPFGYDRNGNSVADENEQSCSVSPVAPVFPAMDGCTNPAASAEELAKLKSKVSKGERARDVLRLGQFFAGVELGVEYMFTPLVGLSASGQLGGWFGGRYRASGLVDLKLGPTLRF